MAVKVFNEKAKQLLKEVYPDEKEIKVASVKDGKNYASRKLIAAQSTGSKTAVNAVAKVNRKLQKMQGGK